MRRLALLAAALLAAAPARAQFTSKGAGTSGAQFLKIGPGARPAAMGEAFSSLEGDLHSLYYNPAGLARSRQVQFGGMYAQYFQSIDYNFGALAMPVARIRHTAADLPADSGGVVGFAVYNLAVNDIERRGLSDTNQPTGLFNASDLAYALSYARAMNDRLALGATVKLVQQKIDTKSGSAFALDAGAQYKLGAASLALGVRNLGTPMKLASEKDPLPLVLYAGASRKVFDRLTVSADLNFPRDNDPELAAGLEFAQPIGGVTAAFRAGYYTRNTDPSGLTGLSIGTGLQARRIAFDVAWVPFGDLGNTWRYSLSLRF